MKKKSYTEIESVSQSLVEKAVNSYGKPDYILESATGAFTGLDTKSDPQAQALVASVIKKVDKLTPRKHSD